MTNPTAPIVQQQQQQQQQQPLQHISPQASPARPPSVHQSPVGASLVTHNDVLIPSLEFNSNEDLLGLNPPSLNLNSVGHQPPASPVISADDDTAPSSSDETPLYNVEGTAPDEDEDGIYLQGEAKPLLYGYLHKLGRNGKWQKRFFETDGESLSYYKSEKRSKQLAMLDLLKVGKICISSDERCTFKIQVADRPYLLRAENQQTCMDWVISLNRIKEARHQLGRVKLVSPSKYTNQNQQQQPPDLLSSSGHSFRPRIVMSANRERSHAVNNKAQWQTLIDHQQQQQQQGAATIPYTSDESSERNKMLANWVKPRNTLYRVKQKIIKWARSIKQIAVSCAADNETVHLDNHLHPPGHDGHHQEVGTIQSGASSDGGGGGGGGLVTRTPSHDDNKHHQQANFKHVGEEGEIRELA